MSKSNMTPDEVLAMLGLLIDRIEGEDYIGTCSGCSRRKRCACKAEHDEIVQKAEEARTAVAALIAESEEDKRVIAVLRERCERAEAERLDANAENQLLRAAYHKARNAAAGFSNYCEESASSRRCERDLSEAERMFRDIDASRAEAGHG